MYESLSCTISSALEIVRHFHFCHPQVKNGICQAEHCAPVTSTWGGGGGTPTTWRIAEVMTMPATRNRNPNTFAHCILVLGSPRKTQVKHCMECFYSQREKRVKSALIMCVCSPWLESPPSSQCRAIGLHASWPSCATAGGPWPPWSEVIDTHAQAEQRSTHWAWNRER